MTKSDDEPQGLGQDLVLIDSDYASPPVRQMAEAMKARVIGQDHAIDFLAQGLEIDESGLYLPSAGGKKLSVRDPMSTLAQVALFTGPPGNGKSETGYVFGKVWIGDIAEDVFGKRLMPLTLIDCTKFHDYHTIGNLIGATKSYVGYDEPTPLSQESLDHYAEQVLMGHEIAQFEQALMERKRNGKALGRATRSEVIAAATRLIKCRPHKKVLMFDEVGRAHPIVWNLLITILNGELFEFPNGSVTDFQRTALFMNMNLDEQGIRQAAGAGMGFKHDWREADAEKLNDWFRKRVETEIKKIFPPALVSRLLGNVVVFRVLDDQDRKKLLDLRLSEVSARFESHYGKTYPDTKLVFTDACRDVLLKRGFDPVMGARPLQGLIRSEIIARLTRVMNWQKTVPGFTKVEPGCTVVLDRASGLGVTDERIELYVQR